MLWKHLWLAAVQWTSRELEATVVRGPTRLPLSSSDDVLRGEVSAASPRCWGPGHDANLFPRCGVGAPTHRGRREAWQPRRTGAMRPDGWWLSVLGDSYHRAWNDALRLAASVGGRGLPMCWTWTAGECARHTARRNGPAR